MSTPIHLNGITWNHTRGFLPMVATAQRFGELNHDIEIHWQRRSLQEFADMPLVDLARRFDLLVIDHPSIGEAAELNLLAALDEYLPSDYLADQAANSVGESYRSYTYNDHQWALAVDSATPIAGWRPDLLARADADVPKTWEDLLSLARKGFVAIPAVPIDSLMHLFMMSNALGYEPFSTSDEVLPTVAAAEALERLRQLISMVAPPSLGRNPIATWQLLAESSDVAYCPFAYGYSNYSRSGYAAHRLEVGPLVSLMGKPLRSTLGGAGLAISNCAKYLKEALTYAAFVASPEIQRTLYTTSGGQPGHRSAWVDNATNELCNGFFRSTLSTLDDAWVRPRFSGFISFQNQASIIVHDYLKEGGDSHSVLNKLNGALRTFESTRKMQT
jgi:multiple sugar transport system substrate-binding protein